MPKISGYGILKRFIVPVAIVTVFLTVDQLEPSAAFAQDTNTGVITTTKASRETGNSYVVRQRFGTLSDTGTAPTVSKLRIFENGRELGPAHSLHADIGTLGMGRFSHWGGSKGTLVITALYFSASDNTDPRQNGRVYTYRIDSQVTSAPIPAPAPAPAPSGVGTVRTSMANYDSGYSYTVMQDFGTLPDTGTAQTVSKLRIFENGRELSPAHSMHADIRTLGMGRFSHWGGTNGTQTISSLYFSASDNSDPRQNGRVYTYRIDSEVTPAPVPALVPALVPAPAPAPARTPPPPTTATSPAIGPQPVSATPLSQGTLFAAPNGSGWNCTAGGPCSLATATDRAIAGDIVFLRGGVYPITANIFFGGMGTAAKPITFESYPGESAVLDGSTLAEGTQVFIRITGDYNVLRKMEIRKMPAQGLYIRGNHNTVDGLFVHHNKISGIHIHNGDYSFPYGALASYNTIQNSTVSDNSDLGPLGDGGNADGISISSGTGNSVLYCLATRNSDDGIDAWRSTNTVIAYSIATENGLGAGNGNGIKAGGKSPSRGTVVHHVVTYKNRAIGADFNSGVNVTFSYVTSWANGASGFSTGSDTMVDHSISLQNASGHGTSGGISNSWQRIGTVAFDSTVPASVDFLKPTVGSGFEDIGAVR
jgi:parallel beta helix pectate lyase-like protein